MAELNEYDVVINGTETTLLLTEDDAKERGLKRSPAKKASAPADNKSRTPSNKSLGSPNAAGQAGVGAGS